MRLTKCDGCGRELNEIEQRFRLTSTSHIQVSNFNNQDADFCSLHCIGLWVEKRREAQVAVARRFQTT